MNRVSRRSFIEKLGLGAGAVLLSNIANTLVKEAQGAASVGTRKRVVFYLNVNGIQPLNNFSPPEFKKADPRFPNDPYSGTANDPVMNGPTQYTMPRMLKALEPYRNRMMLIDGLANRLPTSQHTCGYGALSCITAASGDNENGGAPGGITIDQYIANKIGADTAVKSLLIGINKGTVDQSSSVFAAGKNQPLPYLCGENVLYNKLFATMAPTTSTVDPALKSRVLMDSIKDDVKRLQSALAGPEREKLDQYLNAITSYETGMKARMSLSCKDPPKPRFAVETHTGNERDPLAIIEDRLESMIDMTSLAIACGMTNVVGNAVACGYEHSTWLKYYRLYHNEAEELRKELGSANPAIAYMDKFASVVDAAHNAGPTCGPAMDLIHNFHAGCIKRLIEPLMAIKEGDKTIFDNTVVVYTSDNGDDHHAAHDRWPIVLVGDAGGALKSDGRFVRYPIASRSMADFFCTIATAVGVPTNDFGTGGVEPVKGPLSEIMA